MEKKAITEKLYPVFTKILNDNDVFKSLMCPISFELPSIPVKAPCNHVFEYEAIVAWQKKKSDWWSKLWYWLVSKRIYR